METTLASQPAHPAGAIEGQVVELVRRVLNLDIPAAAITRETNLFELGADSMNALELFLAMEQEFGFQFDEDELSTNLLKNMGSILDFVSAKFAR